MGMAAAAPEPQFHVLAVDDSLIDRKLIEKLLKTSSYQVTTVDSGCKALEFLGWSDSEEERSNPTETSVSSNVHQEMGVNLVITDYCMPEMTGFDLLKKMKKSSYLRNIPVVIMSSENVPSRINRCLEEGAEEFFLKPVRLSDVSKLKPHLMRTKFKSSTIQGPENMGNQDLKGSKEEESGIPAQKQQKVLSNKSNIKRKSSDHEGLLADRLRQKYSGFTVITTLLLSLVFSLCFLVFG